MGDPVVSHIGIAVRDLDSAIEQYRLLTGCEPELHEVPDQQVRVAMFASSDGDSTKIELLAATTPDSPIAKFIERRGEGLHHICLFTDDIERKLAELSAAGAKLIDAEPRLGAEGCRIAFVHPSGGNGVLIELSERTSQVPARSPVYASEKATEKASSRAWGRASKS
jgi:methylmalonyl-CoA/ethylmalonyl-CoA epimerase